MRIKILPLLIFASTTAFISGCVKQTETTITVEPELPQNEKKLMTQKQPVKEKKTKTSLKPKETLIVKLLKNTANETPKFKLVNYVLEKEVENFKKETGIEVIPVLPGYAPALKNRDFVLLEEPDKVRIVVKDSYIFKYNEESIKNRTFLESIARNFGKHLIVVVTYFDNSGSKQFNAYITEKRTDAIRNYLLKLGISNGNILAKWCGDKNPIATNSSVEGRALNRRIEFHIYPAGTTVNRVCKTR